MPLQSGDFDSNIALQRRTYGAAALGAVLRLFGEMCLETGVVDATRLNKIAKDWAPAWVGSTWLDLDERSPLRGGGQEKRVDQPHTMHADNNR